jgi:membrane protease YdiL (CAAX protease family)
MVLVVALYLLLRGQRALPLRIMVVVIGFLVIRDTLISFGVWGYGLGHGWLPYVRFVNDPVLVTAFAVGSILATLFLIYVEKDGRKLLWWGRFNLRSAAWAVGGGIVLAGGLAALYQLMPLADRGGPVPGNMLLPLAAVAAFGNLTEDVLVRGYFQGFLATVVKPWHAAVGAGVFFALCHVFLAGEIVTVFPVPGLHLGVPVLLYALIDGLVCAFVRLKAGLLPAAVSHGMAVFVLATGLI